MRRLIILLPAILLILTTSDLTSAARGILWLEITGYISPGTAEYVEEHIRSAGEYQAVLVTIDTYGGQADAMLRIVEAIQNSPVPVIGFVYPPGGKALSAGSFILLATHFAAMAPGTLIGSAQPVIGGVPATDTKIVNFFVAKIRSLAELNGRNPAEAEKLVTENKNFDPRMALDAGLIEATASNIEELLKIADGREVATARGRMRLQTDGQVLVRADMGIRSMAVSVLSDPLISGLLITIGIIALVAGLLSPGWGAEVAGGVMILLGLIGQGFNVNLVGVLLSIVGAGLLLFELHTPSFGAVGAGGIIALSLGLILLVGYPPTPAMVSPTWFSTLQTTLIIVAVATVGILAFLGYKALTLQRKRKPVSWEPSGIGRAVDQIEDGGEGFVVVSGEYWRARAVREVKQGQKIRVVGREGNVLLVEPVD
jgi:membrane-bound serine protease (ClpP class)